MRARHQNPFKRKGQKPVAFWCGIIESDGKPASMNLPIPDYFNGTIRVIAVAVSEGAIGVAEDKTISQGYFVIQPQAPYFASPGDEFEVTALVANNLQGTSGDSSTVTVRLDTASSLELMGNSEQQVSITPGGDSTVRFRVRAKSMPGAAPMTIIASGRGKRATYTLDMSIRPASPLVTTITSGYVKKGLLTSVKADLPLHRKMYPQYRDVEVAASAMPLGLSYGMIRYLVNYPYGCTEQVVSAAFPGVVLGSRPELGLGKERVSQSLARAMATLQGRQNSDGSFGLWTSGADTVPFISAYATHFLLEAREHGLEGPPSLLERSLGAMRQLAASPQGGLDEMRAQAYALYLLARSGVVVTNQLVTLREALDRDYPKTWLNDIAVDYMAGAYKLLRMDSEGAQLIRYAQAAQPGMENSTGYSDELVARALYIYIVSKHFPEIAKKLSPDDLITLANPIIQGRQNTFSSAYAILALEAYANTAAPTQRAKLALTEKLTDGSSRALVPQGDLFTRATVPADAVSVHIEGDTPFILFYQLLEAGFDLEPPNQEIKDKIEVFREFRDEQGQTVDSASLESKINVAVSVRALDAPVSNVALVDLLPGGFELDLSREGIANRTSQVQGPGTWHPDYIDVREDRVIFYGTVDTQAQTFVYRLRPTNRG
ncbi:MAG TPA: alpha-2-macroglobulin family protein, partial [Candidatus Binataceae bacterium]|nr:alpha-2-macroglobulin family protein [Candidatus Binataceae bacterium]